MPASSGSFVSRATTGAFIDIKIDERALARAHARISQYEGRKFIQRMERVYRAGTSLLVAPLRKEIRASVKGHGKNPGMLAAKVSVRKGRPPSGYFLRYGVKSRAPHSHLVDLGTKPHSLATKRAGKSRFIAFEGVGGTVVIPSASAFHPGSTPRAFTSRVIASNEGRVIKFIEDNTVTDDVAAEAFTSVLRSF